MMNVPVLVPPLRQVVTVQSLADKDIDIWI